MQIDERLRTLTTTFHTVKFKSFDKAKAWIEEDFYYPWLKAGKICTRCEKRAVGIFPPKLRSLIGSPLQAGGAARPLNPFP